MTNNNLTFNVVALEEANKTSYKSITYNLSDLPEDFVVIKVDYSAIGPYDTGILSHHIPVSESKTFPKTFGFEGVGKITHVGSKVNKDIVGQNCSFMCLMNDDRQIRAYSEYAIIPFIQVYILKDLNNYKNNAYFFGNPFTARGFLEDVLLKDQYSSIIIDTASSALGKMILKLCVRHNIKVITITRSENSIERLKQISSSFININSEDKDFINNLKSALKEASPSLYVTFQGGNLPSRVFDILPNKAKMVSLGNIQREDMWGFSTHPFIFQQKEAFGYTVFDYFERINLDGSFQKVAEELLSDEAYSTELSNEAEECSLADFHKGVEVYNKNSSKGKIVFKA